MARRSALSLACLVAAIGVLTGEPSAASSQSGLELQVVVHGLRNAEGRVAVALFANADDFPDQRRALRGRTVQLSQREARVSFPGLTPGVYAVAVLHDENANDKMDFNWLGMPQEGYGFSRDAAVLFGPPSFDAAALKLTAPRSQTRVQARYFSL